MKVSIGVSNHHVHLTREDLDIVYGKGYQLTVHKMINQPGQYAAEERVDIKINGRELKGLRIVGPERDYTQVEVTQTDCNYFETSCPIRDSGDLKGATLVEITGPNGTVKRECAIIADRHIHVTKEIRKEKGLENIDMVKVKFENGVILDEVRIKETKTAYYEMHIDRDDSNEYDIQNGDIGEIIYE